MGAGTPVNDISITGSPARSSGSNANPWSPKNTSPPKAKSKAFSNNARAPKKMNSNGIRQVMNPVKTTTPAKGTPAVKQHCHLPERNKKREISPAKYTGYENPSRRQYEKKETYSEKHMAKIK